MFKIFRFSALSFLVLACTLCYAQLPQISYQTPQVYTIGVAIPPLTPTSSGVSGSGQVGVVSFATGVANSRCMAVDAAGNVYTSETGTNLVKKFPVAGGAPVTIASGFNSVTSLVADAAGNIYVSDYGNNAVKKIPVGGGAVTVVASGLSSPYSMGMDAAGNLYVSNLGNGTIQKIPSGGGSPVPVGPAFTAPRAIAVNAAGDVFVADNNGSGSIQVIYAGSNTATYLVNFGADINGMTVDAMGNLYFISPSSGTSTVFETLAGTFDYRVAFTAQLSSPVAITVDAKHIIYINDFGNGALKKITPYGGYFISPALPQGLNFNAGTGVISGMSNTGSPATNYTVTGYNSTGGTSAGVNIKVGYNPFLFALTLSNGTLSPAFAPDTTRYMAHVVNATSAITVTPSYAGSIYPVKVNGVSVTPGNASQSIPLAVGVNTITIVTTAPDGTLPKTYTVTVIRASASSSTNAVLASVTLNPSTNITTSPQPGYTLYNTSVPNSETSFKVIPTAQDANATIKVNDMAVASGTASANIPLTVGNNFIYIDVTAQDGATTTESVIVANRAQSSTATLSKILLSSGVLSPVFTPAGTSYTAKVLNTVTSITVKPTATNVSVIKVNGAMVASDSTSQAIPLNVGNNTISIVVTSQDGTATKTYTLAVTRSLPATATLSNLTISSGTLSPVFASATTSYTATVLKTTASVTITPTVSDAAAKVTVNGTAVASGSASAAIALSPGVNTITTVVTAPDGTTKKTYTLAVTRPAASSNALLTVIALTPKITLTATTGPGYRNYKAAIPYTISSIQVTSTAQDSTATITVNGTAVLSGVLSQPIALNFGDNVITVLVKAQDGTTTKSYIITAKRAIKPVATLANLALSTGILSPAFTPAITKYTASVLYATTFVRLTPTTVDSAAIITVNGNNVKSGTASGAVILSLGANTIYTVVTATDGLSTQRDTIIVTRKPASNVALLSSIVLTPAATLTTTTGPGDFNFGAQLPHSTDSIRVTSVATDPTATIRVNGIMMPSGIASQSIPLFVGSNGITLAVTAEDGVTVKNYFIRATRAASADATLSNITASAGTLSPVFASTTYSYKLGVPNAVSSIKITPTYTEFLSVAAINGVPVPSGKPSGDIPLKVGIDTILINVRAPDAIHTQIYTLIVTRVSADLATNTTLSSLKLNPNTKLTVVTGPGAVNYTTPVPNSQTSLQVIATTQDIKATIKVNGIGVASGAPSPSIPLTVGANVITIAVTAADGVTVKNYIVTANRLPVLSGLALSAGVLSPLFASGTTAYTANVPYATSSVKVTPATTVAGAIIKVNGTAVASGSASGSIALSVGTNIITVLATSPYETSAYTIKVTRSAANLSTNAALTAIALTPKTALTIVTGPGYRNYTAAVPNNINSLQVTSTAQDATATITVNGVAVASGVLSQPIPLIVGANVITVAVTAQDGATIKNYIITATRAPSVIATLANLAVSTGALSPIFAPATTAYTIALPNATTSIKVTPTVTDAVAMVTVNGITVASGAPSAAIALTVGINTITTVVTAQDGLTNKTYTLTITRAAAGLSTSALLTSIKITPATALTKVSGPGYVNYTTPVPNNESSLTVTAKTLDSNATIKVNGVAVVSGAISQAIALSVGNNVIYVDVTAQDGATTKSYIITATRAAAAAGMAALYINATADSLKSTAVIIHQAVSPNGDGDNDVLTIDGITNYPDNSLTIIGRNGYLVYEAKGYDNTSVVFDGHSNKNGKLQQAGTYFYRLDYKDKGEVKSKTGFILLKY